MATRQNLIDTYNTNPTLQSRYTQQQYLDLFGFGQTTTPTPPTPPAAPTAPVQNIIGQNLNQGGGGGGGIQGLQQTFTTGAQPKSTYPRGGIGVDELNQKIYNQMGKQMGPFSNDPLRNQFETLTQEEFITQNPEYFSQGIPQRTGLLGVKDRVTDFFTNNRFFQPKVQGTLGTRLANAPRLPLPGAIAAYSLSPFNKASRNYNPNLVSELNFLEGLGEGMIGRDPGTGGLKYGPDSVLSGKNVISGFGTNSYAKALDNYIDKVTNKYDDIVDKYGVNSKKAIDYKFNFVTKAIKEREKNTKNAIDIAKEKEEAARLTAAASRAESRRQYDPNVHGPTNYGLGSDGKQSYDSGQGFGTNATTGGPVSNKTGRGRTDYDDGGMVYLYDRKEMADGGEAESYADIIDAYENGVGVLKGESLTDYIRRNRIKLMDPMGDLEKALFGKANGGPISESDFPFLINRPGENTGRKKPGLSDYDRDTQDYDYYDDDIIEIPMGKMMKKKIKKKKKKKDREDYSDGGRVYLYDRQD